MSLRTRLLVLFGALAVAPLTALGVFDYFRSAHAVERLLATQTSALAERIAQQATRRIELLQRSFRTNAVLRWEWRLGSTLYLV